MSDATTRSAPPPSARYRVDAATHALAEVMRFAAPADGVLHAFFREHPKLGAADRAFVAETVYGALRHARTLEALLGRATPRLLALAALVRVQGMSLRQLEPACSPKELATIQALREAAALPLPPAVAAELPDWLFNRLVSERPAEEVMALGRALQQPAPFDLRVNTLKAAREEVLAALAREGISASPMPYAPHGVRIPARTALQKHPLYLEGRVEVQDEGSQLVSYLVAPRRRELVVDFCAGAGGKTLALGALMNSQGRVYAWDTSARRLARLEARLKRSGLSNVHPQVIAGPNDTRVKRLAGKADRVLVDAPCTGTGTLRRNPDLRWRQDERALAELTQKQGEILAAAARLVKPGGRLVYATCSLLAAENRDIVEAFVAAHPQFVVREAAAILAEAGIALDTGRYLELTPHRHGTDGFFAAVLERAPAPD
jgi:16S rRNA (cytosine967-C5)-methyltransferase